MKRKRLNAMPALLQFLVLLEIFLSASYAHAFTSLSPVAGNQARMNHLIRFEESMSDPTNEPSREPTCEPTNDRKKSEPILSYSHIKRDKSTPTFQLVLASVSNNNALSYNDKCSSKFQLVVASVANECSKGSSKKTAQCTMNNSRQSRSFIDDASIDSWQCPMKIDEVNFQQVGNSASTELVGSCHDKKSEQVGNSASTQLVGFCYDKKSEQLTCSEQEQDAKHFGKQGGRPFSNRRHITPTRTAD
jgi:hypothetical protein